MYFMCSIDLCRYSVLRALHSLEGQSIGQIGSTRLSPPFKLPSVPRSFDSTDWYVNGDAEMGATAPESDGKARRWAVLGATPCYCGSACGRSRRNDQLFGAERQRNESAMETVMDQHFVGVCEEKRDTRISTSRTVASGHQSPCAYKTLTEWPTPKRVVARPGWLTDESCACV